MNNKNLKFSFFGTPDVAEKTLNILKENGYIPSLIITQEDKPQGRKMLLTPPPVKTWAIKNKIDFIQPSKIDQVFIDYYKKQNFEISIVVAYGKILPEELIKIPDKGTLNIHYSLLPKYRGASPVESAILDGLKETGVSIQQMEFKLDSGPILAEKKIEILQDETRDELKDKLIIEGSLLLVEKLPEILNGKIEIKKQDDKEATFCKKIKKEDGEIDIANGKDLENYNKYRAFKGWPGIFFFREINNQKIRIKITEAKYENGKFIILKIVPEGKKEQDYKN